MKYMNEFETAGTGKVVTIGQWDETSIYRYLSVERFLEIVETGRNTLTHVSKWEDPNEAYLIRAIIAANSYGNNNQDYKEWYNRYRAFYGQSWMFNGGESDVLWRAYGKRGDTVRIQTTVKDLVDVLSDFVSGKNDGYELGAYVGAISYVDDLKNGSFHECADIVKSLFVKRREFQDEKEFRLIVKVDDRERKIDRGLKDSTFTTTGGLLKFEVQTSKLIHSVLVDPCCTPGKFDEIRCRVLNVGFDNDIRRSSLFEWPNLSSGGAIQVVKNIFSSIEKADGKASGSMSPESLFWIKFAKRYRNGKSEFAGRRAPDRRYWGFGAGNGFFYNVVFNRDFARVELYIDSFDKEWNKQTYKVVSEEIKKRNPMADYKFDLLPEGRASRISIENQSLKFTDESCHDAALDWLCKMLDGLREATEPIINNLIVKNQDRG